MIKRILLLILSIAVLSSTLLTACGKEKEVTDPVAQSTSKESTTKESTTPALPEVKLTWYLLTNSQPDDALVYAEANKYIKEKINATVDFYPFNQGEYNDKIQVKLASNDDMDIIFTSNWLNKYIDLVAKGALKPLDELMDAYAPEVKAAIPEKYWEYAKIQKTGDTKGRIYGILNYQIFADLGGMAFRKDLAEKYDLVDAIKNAKTYDDLTPIFKVIKEKEPNVIPVESGNLGNYYQITPEGQPAIEQIVSGFVPIDQKTVKYLYKDPTLQENELKMGKARREWWNLNLVDRDALTIKDTTSQKKSGKYFCYTLGQCKPGVEVDEKTKYGFDIIAKQVSVARTGSGKVTATMNAIPDWSKNPERAMMLINLVNTDKYLYNLLNFGIEKTHYTKVDENTIEVLKDSKFNPGMGWALGNQFMAYIQKGQALDTWEQTKKINEAAQGSVLEGFSFNSDPVKTEIAQLTTVNNKYNKIFQNGAADPQETITKRNAEWDANGVRLKVFDEVQKQIDAWKAAKK